MKSHKRHDASNEESVEDLAEPKRAYEAPKVESVKLSDEAAESLT